MKGLFHQVSSLLLAFLFLALPFATVSAETLYVNAKSGLILRAEAKRTAKVVTLIPEGAPVSVLKRSNATETIEGIKATWIEVSFGPQKGWAFGGFLQAQSIPSVNVVWNPSGTMFFVLTNATSTASECGNGFGAYDCAIRVIKGEKTVYSGKGNNRVAWHNDNEITLSSSLGECSGGEAHSSLIDVQSGRELARYETGFANPSCGSDDPNAPQYNTVCLGKNCFAAVGQGSSVKLYRGILNWNGNSNPEAGLPLIGTYQRNKTSYFKPTFTQILFIIDEQEYQILPDGKIRRTGSPH